MNHQDLKDKLRRHYFELQKEKLANDQTFIQLQDMLIKTMDRAVGPIFIIKSGKVEWEPPKGVKTLNRLMDTHIEENYPVLSQYKNQMAQRPPVYENSFVITPDRLTFDKIDARLTLFKTYLTYKLNCLFDSHGWVYDSPLEYDEWLYMKGYEQLIEVIWN